MLHTKKNIQKKQEHAALRSELRASDLKVITFALIGCDFSTDIFWEVGDCIVRCHFTCILGSICCFFLTVLVSPYLPTHYSSSSIDSWAVNGTLCETRYTKRWPNVTFFVMWKTQIVSIYWVIISSYNSAAVWIILWIIKMEEERSSNQERSL